MSLQLRLDEENLHAYLTTLGLVPPGRGIQVEPAGEGNINWVRRARLAGGGPSWVVKQARGTLERFPEYTAPTERIVFEARYYARVAPLPRGGICPKVLAFDESERVLVLEDLGDAERLDQALSRGFSAEGVAAELGAFLGEVHASTRDPDLAEQFDNAGMRRLHGEHIFSLPLRPNAFPLPPALLARAQALWSDRELVATADAACARYLQPRGALIHADVQAGNVLLTTSGPRLLDAEIAHVGDPAFDLGTLLAHLALPAAARSTPGELVPAAQAAWAAYRSAAGQETPGRVGTAGGAPAFREVARYAGIEMLRRTIGAARVEAVLEEAAALAALEVALRWIRTPPEDPAELR